MAALESSNFRRFFARTLRSLTLSCAAHSGNGGDLRQNHNFMGVSPIYSRRSCALLLGLVLGLPVWGVGCAVERPINPLRLKGFPGAPVEPGMFPLRDGMLWKFQDRLHPEAAPLLLKLTKEGRCYYLEGTKAGQRLEIAHVDGFLEVRQGDQVVDRPLKYPGKAGDTWQVGTALVTIFGYDEVDVLGTERMALVVAVDRREYRDIAWFVQGMGWVRLRSERRGQALRDAHLVEYEAGRMN